MRVLYKYFIYIYIYIHTYTACLQKGCLKTDVKCGSFVLQCQMWGKADVKYPILLYKLLWWRGSFDFLLISQLFNIFFNVFLGDLFVKEKWNILVVYNTSEIMHQKINTAKFILDKTFAAWTHASECLCECKFDNLYLKAIVRSTLLWICWLKRWNLSVLQTADNIKLTTAVISYI